MNFRKPQLRISSDRKRNNIVEGRLNISVGWPGTREHAGVTRGLSGGDLQLSESVKHIESTILLNGYLVNTVWWFCSMTLVSKWWFEEGKKGRERGSNEGRPYVGFFFLESALAASGENSTGCRANSLTAR